MGLEIVDLRLLDGAEVADTPRDARKSEVDCQQLPQRWCRAKGGGYTVVVVIATVEHLIVGLSIVGREHQACQRH